MSICTVIKTTKQIVSSGAAYLQMTTQGGVADFRVDKHVIDDYKDKVTLSECDESHKISNCQTYK